MNKLYIVLIFVVSIYSREPDILSTQIYVPDIDETYQIVNTYLYPENTSQSNSQTPSDLQTQKTKNTQAKHSDTPSNNNVNLPLKNEQKSNKQQQSHEMEIGSKQQQSLRDQDIDSQNKPIIQTVHKVDESKRKQSETAEYGKQLFIKQTDEQLIKDNEHRIPINTFSQNNQNLQGLTNRQSSSSTILKSKIPFYKQKISIVAMIFVIVLVGIFFFQRYQQKKRVNWSTVISHLDTYNTTVRVIREEEQQHLNYQESKLEQNLGKVNQYK